jgi:hypothetical protein
MRIGFVSNPDNLQTYYWPWCMVVGTQDAHATLPYTTVSYNNTSAGASESIIALSFPPTTATPASTYFYDFESDTVGYMPAGWTAFNDWNAPVTTSVVDVSGDKRLRFSYSGGDAISYAYNSAIGSIDFTSKTVEMVAKWVPGDVSAYTTSLMIGINDVTGTYGAGSMGLLWNPVENSGWRIQYYNRQGPNGSAIATATPRFALVAGTAYYVRYRRETNGVYKAKIWAATDTEPTSWDMTSSADTSIASGRIGVSSYYHASAHDYSLVGISLDGSTAAITTPSGSAPVNTAVPTISGTTTQGQTLTATTGTWSNSPTSYTYQWYRGASTVISGATSSTYVLTASDVGTTVKVAVTATNASGSATAESASTGTISSSGSAPVNTAVPTISGTTTQGQTLTATTGTWSNSPTSYAYQWYRGASTLISGATSSTYTLVLADVGSTVKVTVTATNASGSASATSASTGTISGISLSAPTITSGGSPTSSSIPISITGGSGATGWTVQFKLSSEPTTWTNESTSITVGATSFTVDQSLAASTSYDIRIAATDGTSTVYSSTYTTSTAAAGGSAPTITNVNTTNIITSTQTGVVITGTNLSGCAVSITQGTTTVTQTVTATTSTTATFTVVFDSGSTDLKYGAATLTVAVSGQTSATKSITINPPDSRSWVTLTSVESTASNRITSSPVDLVIGDQIEVTSVVGGAITDVTLNADGTYDSAGIVRQFYVRVWDVSDSTWGTTGLQVARRRTPVIT